MKRIALATFALTTAAVGAAALWPLSSHRASPADGVADPTGPRRVSLRGAPAAPTPTRDWTLGAQRVYEFSGTRHLRVDGEGGQAAGSIEMTGNLALTPIADDGAFVHVHAQLRQARITATGSDESVPSLDTPFVVTYRRSGALVAVMYPPAVPARTKNELTWMTASLQLTAADDPMAPAWRASERDGTGTYAANYRRGAAEPHALVKTKDAYVHVFGDDARAPADYGLASEGVFDLGSDGWPAEIDVRETTRVDAQVMELAIDAVVRARLVDTAEASDLVAGADALFAGMVADDLDARAGLDELQEDMDRQLARGRSAADVIAALRSAADGKARADLLVQGAAALRLDPGGVADVAAAVRGEAPGEVANAMLGALGASGLADAQNALGDVVVDDAVPEGVRMAAAAALAQSDSHTPESIDDLRDAAGGPASDLSRTATLALGATARTGDRSVVDELLERLADATTTGERVLVIGALGNSGDLRALPALEAALGDPDPRVRREAAEALRFMPDARADDLLDGVLATDAVANVRQAALLAIGFRPFAAHHQMLAVAARHEPAASLRGKLVALLAGAIADPGARDILAYMAEHDADTDVRDAARAALAQPNG